MTIRAEEPLISSCEQLLMSFDSVTLSQICKRLSKIEKIAQHLLENPSYPHYQLILFQFRVGTSDKFNDKDSEDVIQKLDSLASTIIQPTLHNKLKTLLASCSPSEKYVPLKVFLKSGIIDEINSVQNPIKRLNLCYTVAFYDNSLSFPFLKSFIEIIDEINLKDISADTRIKFYAALKEVMPDSIAFNFSKLDLNAIKSVNAIALLDTKYLSDFAVLDNVIKKLNLVNQLRQMKDVDERINYLLEFNPYIAAYLLHHPVNLRALGMSELSLKGKLKLISKITETFDESSIFSHGLPLVDSMEICEEVKKNTDFQKRLEQWGILIQKYRSFLLPYAVSNFEKLGLLDDISEGELRRRIETLDDISEGELGRRIEIFGEKEWSRTAFLRYLLKINKVSMQRKISILQSLPSIGNREMIDFVLDLSDRNDRIIAAMSLVDHSPELALLTIRSLPKLHLVSPGELPPDEVIDLFKQIIKYPLEHSKGYTWVMSQLGIDRLPYKKKMELFKLATERVATSDEFNFDTKHFYQFFSKGKRDIFTLCDVYLPNIDFFSSDEEHQIEQLKKDDPQSVQQLIKESEKCLKDVLPQLIAGNPELKALSNYAYNLRYEGESKQFIFFSPWFMRMLELSAKYPALVKSGLLNAIISHRDPYDRFSLCRSVALCTDKTVLASLEIPFDSPEAKISYFLLLRLSENIEEGAIDNNKIVTAIQNLTLLEDPKIASEIYRLLISLFVNAPFSDDQLHIIEKFLLQSFTNTDPKSLYEALLHLRYGIEVFGKQTMIQSVLLQKGSKSLCKQKVYEVREFNRNNNNLFSCINRLGIIDYRLKWLGWLIDASHGYLGVSSITMNGDYRKPQIGPTSYGHSFFQADRITKRYRSDTITDFSLFFKFAQVVSKYQLERLYDFICMIFLNSVKANDSIEKRADLYYAFLSITGWDSLVGQFYSLELDRATKEMQRIILDRIITSVKSKKFMGISMMIMKRLINTLFDDPSQRIDICNEIVDKTTWGPELTLNIISQIQFEGVPLNTILDLAQRAFEKTQKTEEKYDDSLIPALSERIHQAANFSSRYSLCVRFSQEWPVLQGVFSNHFDKLNLISENLTGKEYQVRFNYICRHSSDWAMKGMITHLKGIPLSIDEQITVYKQFAKNAKALGCKLHNSPLIQELTERIPTVKNEEQQLSYYETIVRVTPKAIDRIFLLLVKRISGTPSFLTQKLSCLLQIALQKSSGSFFKMEDIQNAIPSMNRKLLTSILRTLLVTGKTLPEKFFRKLQKHPHAMMDIMTTPSLDHEVVPKLSNLPPLIALQQKTFEKITDSDFALVKRIIENNTALHPLLEFYEKICLIDNEHGKMFCLLWLGYVVFLGLEDKERFGFLIKSGILTDIFHHREQVDRLQLTRALFYIDDKTLEAIPSAKQFKPHARLTWILISQLTEGFDGYHDRLVSICKTVNSVKRLKDTRRLRDLLQFLSTLINKGGIFEQELVLILRGIEQALIPPPGSKRGKPINQITAELQAISNIFTLFGKQELLRCLSSKVNLSGYFSDKFFSLFKLEGVKEFGEKYNNTFKTFRRPTAIITYLNTLSKKNSTEGSIARDMLNLYVNSVIEGNFYQVRYDTNRSEHLKCLFEGNPKLKESWITPPPDLPLAPLPLSSKSKTNYKQYFETKIITDRHIEPHQVPFLSAYLTDKAFPAGNPSSFEKLVIKLCKNKISIEKFCEIVNKSKVDLGNLKNDINALLQERVQTNSSIHSISESDDPCDLLLSGTEINGSCQSITGFLSEFLTSYLLNGEIRSIVIKNSDGKIVGRALLRLLIDKDSNKPLLFLERIYCNRNHSSFKKSIKKWAVDRAKSMGVSLYSKEAGGKASEVTAVCYKGLVPMFYSDAAGWGIDEGSFFINSCKRFYP